MNATASRTTLEPVVRDRDQAPVAAEHVAAQLDQVDVGALLGECLGRDRDQVLEEVAGRPAGDELGDPLLGDVVDRAEDHVGLGVEVVEHGASRHLGGLGEVVHGPAVEAAVTGELEGAPLEPAGRLGPTGLPLGRGLGHGDDLCTPTQTSAKE